MFSINELSKTTKRSFSIVERLLDEKKQVVLDAINKNGLTLIEEMHQDQWVALIVKNVEAFY